MKKFKTSEEAIAGGVDHPVFFFEDLWEAQKHVDVLSEANGPGEGVLLMGAEGKWFVRLFMRWERGEQEIKNMNERGYDVVLVDENCKFVNEKGERVGYGNDGNLIQ